MARLGDGRMAVWRLPSTDMGIFGFVALARWPIMAFDGWHHGHQRKLVYDWKCILQEGQPMPSIFLDVPSPHIRNMQQLWWWKRKTTEVLFGGCWDLQKANCCYSQRWHQEWLHNDGEQGQAAWRLHRTVRCQTFHWWRRDECRMSHMETSSLSHHGLFFNFEEQKVCLCSSSR